MSLTTQKLSHQNDPILYMDQQFEESIKKFSSDKISAMQRKINDAILPEIFNDTSTKYYKYINSLSECLNKVVSQKEISAENKREVRKILVMLKGMKLPKLVRHENEVDKSKFELAKAKATALKVEKKVFNQLFDRYCQIYYNPLDRFPFNSEHPLFNKTQSLILEVYQNQNPNGGIQKEINKIAPQLDAGLAGLFSEETRKHLQTVGNCALKIRQFAESKIKIIIMSNVASSMRSFSINMPKVVMNVIQEYVKDPSLRLEECRAIEKELSSLATIRREINLFLLIAYFELTENQLSGFTARKLKNTQIQIYREKYPDNIFFNTAASIYQILGEYIIKLRNEPKSVSIDQLTYLYTFLRQEMEWKFEFFDGKSASSLSTGQWKSVKWEYLFSTLQKEPVIIDWQKAVKEYNQP